MNWNAFRPEVSKRRHGIIDFRLAMERSITADRGQTRNRGKQEQSKVKGDLSITPKYTLLSILRIYGTILLNAPCFFYDLLQFKEHHFDL